MSLFARSKDDWTAAQIEDEIETLMHQMKHLHKSQQEIRAFISSNAEGEGGDLSEFEIALAENEVVLAKQDQELDALLEGLRARASAHVVAFESSIATMRSSINIPSNTNSNAGAAANDPIEDSVNAQIATASDSEVSPAARSLLPSSTADEGVEETKRDPLSGVYL